MAHSRIELMVIGLLLLFQAVTLQVCIGKEPCSGKYKGGLKPTDDELKEILKQHSAWVYDGGPINPKLGNDPRRANFCEANLSNTHLNHADLEGANLKNAYLNEAQLSRANLNGAQLSGADLEGADLSHADLTYANLTGAYLISAQLSGANLQDADLSRTDLRRLDLSGVEFFEAHLINANLSQAHLNGADLTNAVLNGAHLFEAHLEGANLSAARLSHAELFEAFLSRADLYGADLSHANLWGTNLDGATLSNAHLEGANLSAAHLNDADLSGADLRWADLRGVQVSKASLNQVNLTYAFYAPASEPPNPYVAGIEGLTAIKAASGEEIGLIQLRKLLQDAGLRDSVREVTFSIQSNITKDQLSSKFLSPAWIAGILRTVGFDWTTAYGLHPERSLLWILLLGALVTPVYMIAIRCPTAESGIMRVFPAGRLEGTAGEPANEQKVKKELVQTQRWRGALRTAAYFSVISAANLGFEQFTPGDWIRRLQTRVYSLEAVGWVRVVAGVQALLSVYLLAIWVLTQFGQPFE